jgi:1-aminocyclopropane-1-carboxylate deaminase
MLLPSPLQTLNFEFLKEKNITLFIKRDDEIHEIISGNKWRKLKYNIEFVIKNAYKGIITFGGAHSNHLSATSFLCKKYNLESIAIVRGDEDAPKSETLLFCESQDTKLIFENRTAYKDKNSETYLSHLQRQYPEYYIIPEGGANDLGVKGCEEIVSEIDIDFDYISIDCGTGATLAGMVRKLKPHQKAIGVQVLKGKDFITEEVHKWSPGCNLFEVWTGYHFGGYAKYHEELIHFMQWFYAETKIKLDPIYTAKQFFSVFDQIKNRYFPEGSSIVLVHSGGLQGIAGFEKRYGVELFG